MTARERLQPLLEAYAAAYRAGDADGCAACFTQDGQLLSPYAPPARGRAEIAALHADWVTEGDQKSLTLQDAGIEGDLGWGLAEFAEGDSADAGLTLCVFARQPGGSWQIRLCSLTEANGTD